MLAPARTGEEISPRGGFEEALVGFVDDHAAGHAPVDTLLREWLLAHGLPWAVIGGTGPARLQQAVNAVLPLLRPRAAAGARRARHQ